jgi:hypothetical protein
MPKLGKSQANLVVLVTLLSWSLLALRLVHSFNSDELRVFYVSHIRQDIEDVERVRWKFKSNQGNLRARILYLNIIMMFLK